MLKAEVKNGARLIQVDGSTKDVIVESAAIINGIYCSLREHSPQAAAKYRAAMAALIALPDSPLWEPQTDGIAIKFGGVFNKRHE